VEAVRKNNWSASGFGKNISPDLIDEKYFDVEIVVLLQGTNMFGDPVYSYVKINGRNLKEMFIKMKSNENFKPADFGTVLAAGRDMPSEEVRAEMAATHNMVEVPVPQAAKPVFVQPKFFGEE
jgi:hypothetical protein